MNRIILVLMVIASLVVSGCAVDRVTTSKTTTAKIKVNSDILRVDFGDMNVGVTPNKVWIDNITVGDTVRQNITVTNESTKNVEFSIQIDKPNEYEGKYTEMPAKWVEIDNSKINIDAKSSGVVGIVINVPTNYNLISKNMEFVVSIRNQSKSSLSASAGVKYFISLK